MQAPIYKKGWIVARNLAGNVFVFNGIIPRRVSVQANPHHFNVTIGKVPNFSYINAKSKLIPTISMFKLPFCQEFEAFYGFMLSFSRLGQEVNTNGNASLVPPYNNNIFPAIAIATATSTENNDKSKNLLDNNDSINNNDDERGNAKRCYLRGVH